VCVGALALLAALERSPLVVTLLEEADSGQVAR
jgi:hypothetical protein